MAERRKTAHNSDVEGITVFAVSVQRMAEANAALVVGRDRAGDPLAAAELGGSSMHLGFVNESHFI